MNRAQHVANIGALMARAIRQYTRNVDAHRETHNEEEVIKYLAKLLQYSV